MEPVTGAWSYSRVDVATMNPSTGTFTPTGLAGAVGTVTFTSGALTATTTATVKLHYTSDPQSVSASTKSMFGQASAAEEGVAAQPRADVHPVGVVLAAAVGDDHRDIPERALELVREFGERGADELLELLLAVVPACAHAR